VPLFDTLSRDFCGIGPLISTWATPEFKARASVPTAGIITRFHVVADRVPGSGRVAGLQGYTFRIRKNGDDTEIWCQIFGDNTDCEDQFRCVQVDGKDVIVVESDPSSILPANELRVRWTALFIPKGTCTPHGDPI
jgi:hypothetical protein